MRGGNTSSGGEQIIDALRNQTAVGNSVIFIFFKIIMTCSAALGVMYIYIIISGGDCIVELSAVFEVVFGKGVLQMCIRDRRKSSKLKVFSATALS